MALKVAPDRRSSTPSGVSYVHPQSPCPILRRLMRQAAKSPPGAPRTPSPPARMTSGKQRQIEWNIYCAKARAKRAALEAASDDEISDSALEDVFRSLRNEPDSPTPPSPTPRRRRRRTRRRRFLDSISAPANEPTDPTSANIRQ